MYIFEFSCLLTQCCECCRARLERMDDAIRKLRTKLLNGLAYIRSDIKDEWMIIVNEFRHVLQGVLTNLTGIKRDNIVAKLARDLANLSVHRFSVTSRLSWDQTVKRIGLQ